MVSSVVGRWRLMVTYSGRFSLRAFRTSSLLGELVTAGSWRSNRAFLEAVSSAGSEVAAVGLPLRILTYCSGFAVVPTLPDDSAGLALMGSGISSSSSSSSSEYSLSGSAVVDVDDRCRLMVTYCGRSFRGSWSPSAASSPP